MRHCLVTGGAGFIGSHIVAELLRRGDRVRVLDNFSSGRRENLPLQHDPRLEVIEGDLLDEMVLSRSLVDTDIVFHEAAFVSVPASVADPATCYRTNILGTALLFEHALKARVKRLVYASSAAVYGESTQLPLSENGPTHAQSPYAISKLSDESLAETHHRSFGLEAVGLRYFNVYGPRQDPQGPYAAAVPNFCERLIAKQPIVIFGDGGQTRDLVFVQDVVRANLRACEVEGIGGRVFNVCTGARTSVRELADALAELLPGAPPPVHAQPRPGDIYDSVGDPELAAAVLNFRAQTSLRQGLREIVEWLQ